MLQKRCLLSCIHDVSSFHETVEVHDCKLAEKYWLFVSCLEKRTKNTRLCSTVTYLALCTSLLESRVRRLVRFILTYDKNNVWVLLSSFVDYETICKSVFKCFSLSVNVKIKSLVCSTYPSTFVNRDQFS